MWNCASLLRHIARKRPGAARGSNVDGDSWLPVSGQEVVELVGRVATGHSIEDVAEPGVGLYAVEFAGFDERGHGGPASAAAIGACEQVVLAAQRERVDGALDGIGVEFDLAIVEEALSPAQRVSA